MSHGLTNTNNAKETGGNLANIAGAVAGNEMQVDVLTMPTVTVNSHAVTNAGTFAVQESGSALTALQLIDDTVATLGTTTYTETSTKGSVIGAVRRDADTTLVDTTNEVAPLQVDARGALKVEVFSGETLPVSGTFWQATQPVSGTFWQATQPVSGTVTANLSATDNAVLDDITTMTTASAVSLGVMDDWDNAASDGASVSGDVAHDAADAGEPVKIGGVATITERAAVNASGDRVNFASDKTGKQIILPYAVPEYYVSGNASNTDGTSTSLIAAQGASVKTYITSIAITNTSASNIYVELKDGTTAKYTIPAPANSGAIITLPTPLVGTANTAWNFDPSAAASTIYCSAAGYKGA